MLSKEAIVALLDLFGRKDARSVEDRIRVANDTCLVLASVRREGEEMEVPVGIVCRELDLPYPGVWQAVSRAP